jgi:hypothetical protein
LNGFVTVIGMDSYPISPDPGLRNETCRIAMLRPDRHGNFLYDWEYR